MDGYKEKVEILLLDIHNALLTIQAILLSPNMSDEVRNGLYDLAVNQVDNNQNYLKEVVSQNLQVPERKE